MLRKTFVLLSIKFTLFCVGILPAIGLVIEEVFGRSKARSHSHAVEIEPSEASLENGPASMAGTFPRVPDPCLATMHIFSYVHSGADYIDRLEAMSIVIFGPTGPVLEPEGGVWPAHQTMLCRASSGIGELNNLQVSGMISGCKHSKRGR